MSLPSSLTPSGPARLRRLMPLLTLVCLSNLGRAAVANTLTVPAQYATIQAAVNAAVNGDTVLIADGTYGGPGNVDLDFGGKNLTVTSQHGAANTIIDCGGSVNANHRGFYLHSGETAVISGLTVQNGYESGSGGGIYSLSVGMTLQNCILRGNTASYGGGVCNVNNGGGTLTLTSCTLTGNTTSSEGGGLFNENYTSGALTLTDCTLTNNTAPNGTSGGAVYNYNAHGGSASLTACTLTGNSASSFGGGIYDANDGGTFTAANCLFAGNSVNGTGGSGGQGDNVYAYNANATSTIINSTITGNSASNSGGSVYGDNNQGRTILTNDILYGGAGGQVLNGFNNSSPCQVTYCDVQGGYSYGGTGNLNADPLFFNPPSDLHLQAGSPCLGAGTPSGAPTTTLDGKTRPSSPSIGAYEAAQTGTAPTTVLLTSSFNPSVAGQTVTFAATVAGAGGKPTGSVTFFVDGIAQTHVPLSSGAASATAAYATASLPGGSHSITAAYGGDAAFAPSTSPALTQIVNKAGTTTSLSSSLNPSTLGQSVAFTATVSGASPTGTVTFSEGGATLGTASLSGGTATFYTSGLAVGSHQITASYAGDGSNTASTSAALTQTVNRAGTTTWLTSSLNPSLIGQSVTFTAFVSNYPNQGTSLTGTITFTVDGAAQTPVALDGQDSATYMTSSRAVGSHSVTAAYSGDGNFAPSTSPTLTQTVYPHVSPQYVSPSGSDGNSGTSDAPKRTIQAAINATFSGDTVIVEDGTYTGPGNVDLDFGGRNVTVTSQHGATTTVIDCGGSSGANHRGFYLHAGETSAVISGLTIQNGDVSSGGGGIFNSGVGVTVQNCVLKNNTATYGGAVYNDVEGSATVTVTGCAIQSNWVGDYGSGGGIYNYHNGSGTISVVNCTFTSNGASYGGGLYNSLYGSGSVLLTNCTLTGNIAFSAGSGIYGTNQSSGTVILTNDILYGDSRNEIMGASVTASYCDFGGGLPYVATDGGGNLNADPLFVSSTDLHLRLVSPCLGAGTASGAPTTTIDGQPRPNPPSIGAYEGPVRAATAISVPDTSASIGQSVVLTATLTSGGAGVNGEAVAFSVDGASVGTGTTNASGVAWLSYAVTTALSAGPHAVTAAFAGDAAYVASSGTGTLTVSKAATTVTVTNASTTYYQTVTLTALLQSGGPYVAGRTVTFKADSLTVGTAVTNANGVASKTFANAGGLGAGSHTVTASFAGDGSYAASSGTGTLTVTKAGATVAVANASSAQGASVTLSATLARTADNALMANRTLSFSVDGATVGTAVTNSSGVATRSYAIPAGASTGSHTVTVAFPAEANYSASSGAGTLTVTQGAMTSTALAVTNAATTFYQTVTLTATLTGGGAGVSGKTVTFKADSTTVGAAVTNASGVATRAFASAGGLAVGSHTLTASFAGDASYASSSGTGALTVAKASTTVTVANASGARGATVSLSATLSRSSDGALMANRTLTFKVDATVIGTGVTNSSGVATRSYAIPAGASVGSHTVTVTFPAEANYSAASGAGTLTVN